MQRRFFQASFGLAVGLTTRLILPGHPSNGPLLTAILSLAGALVGGLVAEYFLPVNILKQAGFAVSALGALTMLLIYGVAVR